MRGAIAIVAGGAVLASAVCAASACRPEPAPLVGVSAPRPIERRASDAGASPPAPSPVPSDFRSTMTRVAARFASAGHADRFDAVLWANDAAKGAWAGSGPMPDGAVLVEEALVRDKDVPPDASASPSPGRSAGALMMQKRGGAWAFAAEGPAGEGVEGDAASACEECHRDAPVDDVFRLASP